MDSSLYNIFILIVSLLAIYVGFKYVMGRSIASIVGGKRDAIVLVGLSNSGKSALLSLLAYKKVIKTVPSMKENLMKVKLVDEKVPKNVELIDIPGHIRLREGYVKHLYRARGIVFFVDSISSSVLTSAREISEFLYHILSQELVRKTPISVLIVCNKQDSILAYKKEAIKTVIEKEINILRSTKSREISTLEDDSEQVFLGYEDSAFKFDDLENNVSMVECSVTKNNIKDLLEWINKI